MTAPTSNEVAGHLYRLAQAKRHIRFYESGGSDEDYASILGPDGKIRPEQEDFDAVSRRRGR